MLTPRGEELVLRLIAYGQIQPEITPYTITLTMAELDVMGIVSVRSMAKLSKWLGSTKLPWEMHAPAPADIHGLAELYSHYPCGEPISADLILLTMEIKKWSMTEAIDALWYIGQQWKLAKEIIAAVATVKAML